MPPINPPPPMGTRTVSTSSRPARISSPMVPCPATTCGSASAADTAAGRVRRSRRPQVRRWAARRSSAALLLAPFVFQVLSQLLQARVDRDDLRAADLLVARPGACALARRDTLQLVAHEVT